MKLYTRNVRNALIIAVAAGCWLTTAGLFLTREPGSEDSPAPVASAPLPQSAGAMARQVRQGMSIAQVQYLSGGSGEAHGNPYTNTFMLIYRTGPEYTQVAFQAIDGEPRVVQVMHTIDGLGYQ